MACYGMQNRRLLLVEVVLQTQMPPQGLIAPSAPAILGVYSALNTVQCSAQMSSVGTVLWWGAQHSAKSRYFLHTPKPLPHSNRLGAVSRRRGLPSDRCDKPLCPLETRGLGKAPFRSAVFRTKTVGNGTWLWTAVSAVSFRQEERASANHLNHLGGDSALVLVQRATLLNHGRRAFSASRSSPLRGPTASPRPLSHARVTKSKTHAAAVQRVKLQH